MAGLLPPILSSGGIRELNAMVSALSQEILMLCVFLLTWFGGARAR